METDANQHSISLYPSDLFRFCFFASQQQPNYFPPYQHNDKIVSRWSAVGSKKVLCARARQMMMMMMISENRQNEQIWADMYDLQSFRHDKNQNHIRAVRFSFFFVPYRTFHTNLTFQFRRINLLEQFKSRRPTDCETMKLWNIRSGNCLSLLAHYLYVP